MTIQDVRVSLWTPKYRRRKRHSPEEPGVNNLERKRQKRTSSRLNVFIYSAGGKSSSYHKLVHNGPYAPFGFESIEKKLWRNKQNDRPISDSEIKAVLSQLVKTD
ncbi:hypothetical protein AVEN_114402-1 [Araneus ventricosus]|uniref:Uncharacterized protein n=1 Tax=Araneus ventricosus TaxID=182803 RepID=A0A4Y2P1Z3_ARAVE|nr:hypothetical protein AVEN_114402-1 [Araneus ventricosus]